jgi:hypothetical protein
MKRLNVITNGNVHVSGTEIPFCLLQGAAVTPVKLKGIWF